LDLSPDGSFCALSLFSNASGNPKFLEVEMPNEETFRDLYLEQLRDLYSAENQLTKALPKMAKAATNEDLKNGFTEHLEQTRGHIQRLEQIFQALNEKPTGTKCKAMEGLVAEGSEMIESDFEGAVKDAGLIAAAQRVEHYEISAYGTAKTFAEVLGDTEAISLLNETEEEERETDEKLTQLASEINAEANGGSADAESDDEESSSKPRVVKAKAAKA
jgi:ferritin-like metal-binding protein YciE